ncbi:hypothetical protein N798_11905 [Knoellia flava TL1]|uniref:Uncharacterized protein n=2 Tax=Knoellia flava TaxID=913969 RepID=A0A8H9KQY9_9MICO|nr:hypothetical protein [Knoellia flava]KGN30058.1 hypothetical protein N798_11905 [Knoellia flava TL1]GGB82169.1 hypothetical protein GCM10011314_22240 [Knoellia flava]
MTVIAFRPRPRAGGPRLDQFEDAPFTGTFRTPLGRLSTVEGRLRVQRLVLVPSGVFVTGVFVAELREADGTFIGIDSRRATVPADLVRRDDGLRPVVRATRLSLMGLELQIAPFPVDPRLTLTDDRTAPARGEGPSPRRGHLRPAP